MPAGDTFTGCLLVLSGTHRKGGDSGEVTIEERIALCDAHVTLDGQPAYVSGYELAFARVRLAANGLGAEWSWETVARIVANGGRFAS